MENQGTNRFERRRQRTRALLQKSAVELVLERGYEAVTIQDITGRADLGRGTFYIHYKDKEECLWDALLASFPAQERGIKVLFAGELPDGADRLGYRVAFEHAAQNHNLYRILLGSQGSAALTRRIHEFFTAEIEREIRERGMFADYPQPPEVVAQYVSGALLRLVTWWLETPNNYTSAQMAEMFFDMLHKSEGPAPAARSLQRKTGKWAG